MFLRVEPHFQFLRRHWSYGLPISRATAPKVPGRAAVLQKSRQQPDRQLLIVRYGPVYNMYISELVCNRVDLGSARVIRAYEMGPAKNQELTSYFKDRHIWPTHPDESPDFNPARSSRPLQEPVDYSHVSRLESTR